jgi:NAD(P)H-dependent FMN reductase
LTDRPRLQVLITSTRPGRVGLPVGQWFADVARADGRFEVDLADLAEINLPFMDEPNHPRLQRYEHQHTKDWAARVDSADAFVFVTPEYNYGFSAPLKNALDYLNLEWNHKPVSFVGYGGISAGSRAIQMIKQVVTTLRMSPLFEAVYVPLVAERMDDEGRFVPNEIMEAAAAATLDELLRVEKALRPLRKAA